MRWLARWFVALVLSVGVTVPARAGDDPKKVARQHYEAGAEAMKKGDYAGARKDFQAAYAASPNFRVLYDIAEADLGLGLPEQALDAFQRFLDDGGEQVPEQQREQVTQQIAQLELGFALLDIVTEPPGAEVTLDGGPLGTTPLARSVRLRAGVHVIGASRRGAAAVTRVVTLEGGDHVRVTLSPPDASKPPAVAAPAPTSTQPLLPAGPHEATGAKRANPFPLGYVLIGAGLVAGGVATTEYFWNQERVQRFRANQAALQTDTSPGRRDRVMQNNALADSINRASAVTVGFGIAAGALVAGGVVWLLVEPGAKNEHERASTRLERWVPNVVVSRDALAASWRGTW